MPARLASLARETLGRNATNRDGATHSTMRSSPATLRSGALGAQGFALLRFTNDELFHNLEGCWKRSI
jgi:very-short-patch-repair endonuclease